MKTTDVDLGDDYRDSNSFIKTAAKARILIVDDEVRNLKLYKAYLDRQHYDIITAENGLDALQQANQKSPDVILLDVMMPGIDGFGVTRRLKQNKDTANIPIILLTALSGEENRSRGMDAGADEYLTKPVKSAELIARVKSMIRLKRIHEQLIGRRDTLLQVHDTPDHQVYENKPIPTILIVEDDEKDALLIKKQIDNGPYIVKHVTHGEEAIRLSLEASIDLMLLDIMLPGINGFEVCRRIKGDDQLRNIQIVMQTSLRDLDFRIQGTDLGADDYLVKPVEPRELKARVDALLKKKAYIDKLQNNYEKAMNQAISDGLTGLFNHSHFRNFLELEIKRSKRQNHPVSLLLLDLDNFKQINDRFGHLSGDTTLIQVANIIKKKVREIDFVARYGGEEFAVILPYTGIDEARYIAERIGQAIVQETTLYKNASTSDVVSASIGVAFYPADGKDIESLIRKADEMMYLAKQCGKNQVCATSDFRG